MQKRPALLNDREHATVLAALRWYQEHRKRGLPLRIDDIATNGGKLKSLTVNGIDELCQKLNRG